VKLPVSAADNPAYASSLPAGIRVSRPGVLEVEFQGAEDLLGRLLELVRIAGHELAIFEEVLSGGRSL
jgi:hypothetical protein